jgi:2',3'-cyclic-nucleotide 2'-phosphodiesterase/3'-nucleotidase
MERKAGRWTIAGKQARLIRVTDSTAAAPDIVAIGQPYHDWTERYLNTPVADSASDLSAALGRVEDTAVIEAIQRVQLEYAKADVSFTALFDPGVRIAKGRVTVRQIAALYPYENELYAIEGDGWMVKAALENAARYFRSCNGARCSQPPLINPDVLGFNYDMAAGVEYEIDLTRPEGDRIRDLRWKGAPLAPQQKLRIAINNYRAAGSAGYGMFRGAKVVWRSGDEVRDLIVRYYTERKELPSRGRGNWKIVPEEARQTLEKEAAAMAARHSLQ